MRVRAETYQGLASAAWTRSRLYATVGGVSLLVLLLLIGLGYSLVTSFGGGDDETGAQPSAAVAPTSGPAGQDALAAKPMPSAAADAFQPGTISTRDPGVPIALPAAKGRDRLGVATGFPHTPEGALAQLAAIDRAALESGSLASVRAVITQWAMPGGPTPTSWSGVTAMAELLTAAQLPATGSPQLSLTATPAMGLIKGTVTDDYAVVCVDFLVDAQMVKSARAASADCQRMVWTGGGWKIGPGPEPARPAAIWPGSDASFDYGWKELSQ